MPSPPLTTPILPATATAAKKLPAHWWPKTSRQGSLRIWPRQHIWRSIGTGRGKKPPTGEEPTIRHRRDAKPDELEQSARSGVDEQPMRWSTRKTTATMAEKQPGGIPTAAQRSAIWERPKSTGSIPTATQQTPPTAH